MKNLLALLGLSIVVVGAVGWHQGWYKLSITKNSDGSLRIQTDVNTAQARQDIGSAIRKSGDFVETHIDNPPTTSTTTTQPATTSTTPSKTDAVLKDGAGWLLGNVLGSQTSKK